MKKISSDFAQRIDNIDWKQYDTAYGRADIISEQLKRLVCGDREIEMKAAHDLWCGLCHQHAYISSAALPAFPFLLEVLKVADDEIAVEILDIFFGFVGCSCPEDTKAKQDIWKRELRAKLTEQATFFSGLMTRDDEVISELAESITENLILYPS